MLMTERKDFRALESQIREEFDPMLSVNEVRNIIGCSWRFVIGLVQDGRLTAVDITGRAVDRRDVDDNSHGLRIPPSSLRDYLDQNTIR
jgi:hypothetical protein